MKCASVFRDILSLQPPANAWPISAPRPHRAASDSQGCHRCTSRTAHPPQVVTLAPQSVSDKLAFLLGEAQLSAAQLTNNPAPLRLSLRRRLLPRLHYMRARGLAAPPGRPLLTARAAMLSDRDFLRSVERQLQRGGLACAPAATDGELGARYAAWRAGGGGGAPPAVAPPAGVQTRPPHGKRVAGEAPGRQRRAFRRAGYAGPW